MLIDWFTVIAQAINFLLLVWLLKRFLYQPILNAIDAREKRIAAELADADAKRAEAKMEREEFQRKNDEFDQQRAALLNKVTNEAAAERQRLFDAARKDSDVLRAKRQDMLNSEYQGMHEEMARRTRAEVFAIARKALTDLAGLSLEERMVDAFVRRLRELGSEEKERLASISQPSPIPVLVHSAFDLPPAQCALIEGAVKETLAAETQVRFEVVPDLVSGIELTMQGQKIAWSIADYLASLEKGVNELLKAQPKPERHES
ncbi:MAG TPA: F0F1 ATP synthase subunit B [Gallionella sp.]|nr:F0F1 ATP synthase subunit B [Gallionella sp.]